MRANKQKKSSIWKQLRILVLLIVLLVVIVNTLRDQTQDWNKPIVVALYPVNADQSTVTEKYIQQLKIDDFQDIAEFLNTQSKKYNKNALFYFRLGEQVKVIPPDPPSDGGILSSMMWSLKFRYYAWKHEQNFKENISLYLRYYDPKNHPSLKHSVALQKGRVALVNLFSSISQNEQNKIVIAHEMLHMFGATDKYNFSNHQPIYPQGFADPDQNPRYPQRRAEIMAGTIASSDTQSKMAESLHKDVVINQATASEIGW